MKSRFDDKFIKIGFKCVNCGSLFIIEDERDKDKIIAVCKKCGSILEYKNEKE